MCHASVREGPQFFLKSAVALVRDNPARLEISYDQNRYVPAVFALLEVFLEVTADEGGKEKQGGETAFVSVCFRRSAGNRDFLVRFEKHLIGAVTDIYFISAQLLRASKSIACSGIIPSLSH